MRTHFYQKKRHTKERTYSTFLLLLCLLHGSIYCIGVSQAPAQQFFQTQSVLFKTTQLQLTPLEHCQQLAAFLQTYDLSTLTAALQALAEALDSNLDLTNLTREPPESGGGTAQSSLSLLNDFANSNRLDTPAPTATVVFARA